MPAKTKYQLSNAAKEDLKAIRKYGRKEHGLARSSVYIAELISTLDIIADNPELGRLRTELDPPVRVHPHGAHVLIYKLSEDRRPLILAIRGAAEDWLA